LTSAKEVVSIRPAAIKIPSACNHNLELLNFLCTAFAGDIYISLGMTTFIERQLLDQIFFGYSAKIVVFHCTSAYPCPFENLYLNEISYLANKYDRTGFSNHGYGISADSAALALGARYFERHFIDDRSFRHTDASASLEPTGMAKLCRDLHNVHKALEYKPPQLDKLELEQRNKLRTDTDQRGLVES
jgi:sialic acid synthase